MAINYHNVDAMEVSIKVANWVADIEDQGVETWRTFDIYKASVYPKLTDHCWLKFVLDFMFNLARYGLFVADRNMYRTF